MSTTNITLYFLQASRSIRIAWLLEELNLAYDVKFFDRMSNMKAPPEFKEASGNPLGKAPTLKDGEALVYESGAITEYLCDKYDTESRLLPKDPIARTRVLQWLHASEATFLLHALAITYARWTVPERAQHDGVLEEMEKGLAVNVQKDLDWLDQELGKGEGRFLCGDRVTAADTMMLFSVDFMFKKDLGVKGGEWRNVKRWVEDCVGTDGYKRAVERTGHKI